MKPLPGPFPKQRVIVFAGVLFTLLWAIQAALALSTEVRLLAGLGFVITVLLIFVVFRHQAQLRSLAHTDPLTGLINHGGFHEALRMELLRARREENQLSLISIDLDDFKAVNDAHGHPYGDGVLRSVGDRLRGAVREGDVAARVGGEKFALVLPKSGAEASHEIAERARAAVACIAVHDAELSCSAGIATYPADAEDASTLCQLADSALYWAKRAGKQRTRHFDAARMKRSLSDRQATEVREALGKGAIRSAFQPVVALANGRLIGFEALARFPAHPARPTSAWFAMADASGLGPEMEATAIRAALEPLGRPPGTHLAFNVSPSMLLSETVQAALPRDLSEVVVEVTEHEALVEDEAVGEALRQLRERGARIAIDDAGAGYSGLKQLTQLNPDIVKLDRNLTQEIHTDPARMALIESFVRFARRTDAIVCAEGIETLEELAALADLDVEWGQGYALGRPSDSWPGVSRLAAGVCRAGLDEAMRPLPAEHATIVAGDRGLERLSARLASARTRLDLEDALPLLAAEINADAIALSQWHSDGGVLETLAETRKNERTRFDLDEFPLTAKVLRSQEAVQVMVGDPDTEPSEVELLLSLGYGSLLIVPVIHGGQSVGSIEAYCHAERPWSRTEISRARIISNQFASVIEALFVNQKQR